MKFTYSLLALIATPFVRSQVSELWGHNVPNSNLRTHVSNEHITTKNDITNQLNDIDAEIVNIQNSLGELSAVNTKLNYMVPFSTDYDYDLTGSFNSATLVYSVTYRAIKRDDHTSRPIATIRLPGAAEDENGNHLFTYTTHDILMQLSCFSKHVAEAYTRHLASGGDTLAWSADMKASLSQYIYSGAAGGVVDDTTASSTSPIINLTGTPVAFCQWVY